MQAGHGADHGVTRRATDDRAGWRTREEPDRRLERSLYVSERPLDVVCGDADRVRRLAEWDDA